MGWWYRVRGLLERRLLYRPYFATRDVRIGRHVWFGRNVAFHSKKVRIGDGVILHDDLTFHSDVLEIGDYCEFQSGSLFPGPGELRIGHNFWLGTGSIVDAKGGATIGDNVGVGAHSQLWTHMVHGDVLYGCRFDSKSELRIDDDAWLVGHCLVSPVHVGARAMAMLGSVVTRDLAPDHTYAGVPAKDVTERLGRQIEPRPIPERAALLEQRFAEFRRRYPELTGDQTIAIVTEPGQMPAPAPNTTVFNVADRTYLKRGTRWERALMGFLLPAAKFVPHQEP